jgi:predicted nucleic acid-binding protein
MTTPPTLSRSAALLAHAIGISSRMRIGVYDCLYLALAERRKCKLVTADDKLVNKLIAVAAGWLLLYLRHLYCPPGKYA